MVMTFAFIGVIKKKKRECIQDPTGSRLECNLGEHPTSIILSGRTNHDTQS